MLCVNDDWPLDDEAYSKSMPLLHDLLLALNPEPAAWERPVSTLAGGPHNITSMGAENTSDNVAPPPAPTLRRHVCSGSGAVLELPTRAFEVPRDALGPLLSHLTPARRIELHANPTGLSPDELTASIPSLDAVDVDNTISDISGRARVAGHADGPAGQEWAGSEALPLRVAELNAQRGRYWCELAVQILANDSLRAVDVWILNEFDLGMARSEQEHTTRLLAYALGFNYAWGVEFVELTLGNREEQARLTGRGENRWGLHGNAILSRWPLSRPTVVRMPGMAELYKSRGPETAGGYERRLGGRMMLLASTPLAGGPLVTVGTMHAQTSWWYSRQPVHKKLVAESSGLLRAKLAEFEQSEGHMLLLGGDTWPTTCGILGLDGLVNDRSPSNRLVGGKVHLSARAGMDDFICGRGYDVVRGAVRLPCVGRLANSSHAEFALSDHVFVIVDLRRKGTGSSQHWAEPEPAMRGQRASAVGALATGDSTPCVSSIPAVLFLLPILGWWLTTTFDDQSSRGVASAESGHHLATYG